jgi:hypothetical protein
VGFGAQQKSDSAQAIAKEESVISSLPGIVGAGSLVAGIALVVTARRKDEPNPKYKVK